MKNKKMRRRKKRFILLKCAKFKSYIVKKYFSMLCLILILSINDNDLKLKKK